MQPLLQLFLLKAYLKKKKISKTHFSSSVGIWLFGSVVVWHVGVFSPSSFLGFFTVTVCMCWMFLCSQDGKCAGSGPWLCAAVAVPADAAPGHCPSGSSTELISRLSLPGEFQTGFTIALPCNEHFVHQLRSCLAAAQNCERKTVLGAPSMTCSTFCPQSHSFVENLFTALAGFPVCLAPVLPRGSQKEQYLRADLGRVPEWLK